MTDEALTQAREALAEWGWPDQHVAARRIEAALRDLIEHTEQVEAERNGETRRAEAALMIVDEHNEARIAAEAERDDLGSRLSELLWELTDGRMSKTGYDVRTMVGEVEAAFERAAQAEIQVYADMATRALAERAEWQAKAEARTQITDETRELIDGARRWAAGPFLGPSTARELDRGIIYTRRLVVALEAALNPKETP